MCAHLDGDRSNENDPVDRVRSRHQRCVQDGRDLGDDLKAYEGGQDKGGQIANEFVAHRGVRSDADSVACLSSITQLSLVGDADGVDDLIVEVDRELALMHEREHQIREVSRVGQARMMRDQAR